MTGHGTEISSDKFTVRRTAEGYVYIAWHDEVEVNVNDARAALDAIAEVSSGEQLPLLVDMSSMRKIDREAREEFSATRTVNRVALIVRTALSRTVGSFFVGLGNPQNPTRLFTDEADALEWLLDDG